MLLDCIKEYLFTRGCSLPRCMVLGCILNREFGLGWWGAFFDSLPSLFFMPDRVHNFFMETIKSFKSKKKPPLLACAAMSVCLADDKEPVCLLDARSWCLRCTGSRRYHSLCSLHRFTEECECIAT